MPCSLFCTQFSRGFRSAFHIQDFHDTPRLVRHLQMTASGSTPLRAASDNEATVEDGLGGGVPFAKSTLPEHCGRSLGIFVREALVKQLGTWGGVVFGYFNGIRVSIALAQCLSTLAKLEAIINTIGNLASQVEANFEAANYDPTMPPPNFEPVVPPLPAMDVWTLKLICMFLFGVVGYFFNYLLIQRPCDHIMIRVRSMSDVTTV